MHENIGEGIRSNSEEFYSALPPRISQNVGYNSYSKNVYKNIEKRKKSPSTNMYKVVNVGGNRRKIAVTGMSVILGWF